MEFIYQDPKTKSASEDAREKLDPNEELRGMDPKAAHDLVVACGRTLDPTPCNVTFINNPGREGINENTPGERERIRGRRERAGPDGAHTRFMKRALRLADVSFAARPAPRLSRYGPQVSAGQGSRSGRPRPHARRPEEGEGARSVRQGLGGRTARDHPVETRDPRRRYAGLHDRGQVLT